MPPPSRARTERGRRDRFGRGRSREASRRERRRPDDAEYGLLYDVVAGRNRLAHGSPFDAGCIIGAFSAGRTVDALDAGCVVSALGARRTVDALDAGCIVSALGARGIVSAVSAGRTFRAFSTWCLVGPIDAGRAFGRRLLTLQIEKLRQWREALADDLARLGRYPPHDLAR